jgi:hypothetical protein
LDRLYPSKNNKNGTASAIGSQFGKNSRVPTIKSADEATVNSTTLATDSVAVGKCRIFVRGLAASMRRSARRLKAMAALRAPTMQISKPARCSQRKGGSGCVVSGEWWVVVTGVVQAITAASSAKGSAKTVWLKRIISKRWRTVRNMPCLNYCVASTEMISSPAPVGKKRQHANSLL